MPLIDTVFLKKSEIEIHQNKSQVVIITGDLVEHAQSLILTKQQAEDLATYLIKACDKIKSYEIDEETNRE